MLRLTIMAGVSLLVSVSVLGQLKKFYSLKESCAYDTVDFYLKAGVANCLIQRFGDNKNPLSIYGNPDLEKINPSFQNRTADNTAYVGLILNEYNSSTFRDHFSFAMLRNSKDNDFWKIDLSGDKVYRLDLNYGFGNADINLTGSSVQKFKMKLGSADIYVGYEEGSENPVKMDTFYIKADFGSVIVKHMELARAKHVITKIGFGNVLLDFEKELLEKCVVDASVGAGNLEIILPKEKMPVILYIKDSPLCSVKLAEGFEEVERNVFVNRAYEVDAENQLIFNIDVALGHVRFQYID